MNSEIFIAACAGLISVTFFSGIVIYGGLFVWDLQPVHFIAAMIAMVAFLAATSRDFRIQLDRPLIKWAAAYLTVCCIWYALFAGGDPETLRKRILYSAFLVVSYLLFVQSDRSVLWARRGVLLWLVVDVFLNAYDISHPFSLVPAGSDFANPGRAAGLYVNANHAAAAVVLGFILTIDLIPQRWRTLYSYAMFVATVLTVSRAGILGFLLALLLLSVSHAIRARNALLAIVLLASTVAAAIGFAELVLPDLHLDLSRITERAAWFIDPSSEIDLSQNERTAIAGETWARITDHPFVGVGFGAAEGRITDIATHDLYLSMMSDFGILGCVWIPAFAWACVCNAKGRAAMLKPAFLGFVIFWALFDHGPLVSYYFLAASALMAAMSDRSAQNGATPSLGRAAIHR